MTKKTLKSLCIIVFIFTLAFLFLPLNTQAKSKPTYTIKPSSKPCDKEMLKFHTYNKKTRQYYTIRSYMEKLEKKGGGTLILTKGTYTITNTIYVPGDVTIKLSNGTVIKKGSVTKVNDMPASNSIFMLIEPSKSLKKNAVSKYNGAKNISFTGSGNATIDMQNYKASADAAIAIEGCHNKNIKISGITFKNMYDGHFIEMDATDTAEITDCTFSDIKGTMLREAINLDTPDEVTQGFHADWAKLDCYANKNIEIKNCTFKNMYRAIGTHNYSGNHPHENINISNCTFSNISQYAVELMYWKASTIENCTMTGNSYAADNAKPSKKGAAIFAAGVINPTIRNNIIDSFAVGAYLVPWEGQSDEEKSAYEPINCIFSSENLETLKTNICGPLVAIKEATCKATFSDEKYLHIPMKTN